jgi:hypothetical protein
MKASKSVEQFILDTLRDGPLSIEDLINEVNKGRKGTTRQAVYRVIRVLKKSETVTVHNKTVSLSALWISKMQDYFALASYHYARPNADAGFLTLREGEKITYSFHTLVELDVFWSHALYLFIEILRKNTPVYVYNPHDWANIIRRENDETLVKKSFAAKRQILIAVGNESAIGKATKRKFENDQGQYYITGSEFDFKRNYYINTIDDYCIEGFLDKSFTEQLDTFYNTYSTLSPEALQSLEAIISKRGKFKLVISRNKKKSEKIKKVLNKYFYIKNTTEK